MATYVPNALDATQPTGDKTVESAALEFRTIKAQLVDLNTVAGAIAAVITVANDLNEPVSEIETVATSIANVNTVGGAIANVNTVAGAVANVNTVAGSVASVNTVAANIAGVNTTVANLAAILDAPVQAAAAAASYDSFDDRYLGAKGAPPVLDNDNNALIVGALYWSTADNKMYTWTALNTWVAAYSGTISPVVDLVDFSTVASADAERRLKWNDTDGTLDLGLKGGVVSLQVGQEQVLRVLNDTGVALADGQAVYITGAAGQRATVALAKANTEITSRATIGVVTEPIGNNAQGFITLGGLVRNIDTSAWADGTTLWLSAATAGALTSVRPVAPNHGVRIGWVVRSHAALGQLLVSVQNGHELDELHDVLIAAIAAGHMLRWNAVSSVWENFSLLAEDQRWTGSQRGDFVTDNDLSFDLNAAQHFKCTPTAGGVLTFTNIPASTVQSGTIFLVNGANYAITAAATTKITASDLAKISATGTYKVAYDSDGTNVYVSVAGSY